MAGNSDRDAYMSRSKYAPYGCLCGFVAIIPICTGTQKKVIDNSDNSHLYEKRDIKCDIYLYK